VVERGFAIVTRPDGNLVRDAQVVAPGEGLVIRLGAGQMNVTRDEEGAGHEQ
jgi:exonuclease VII large subunit